MPPSRYTAGVDSDAAILAYVRRARWRAAATSGFATALSLAVLAVVAYLVALLLLPGAQAPIGPWLIALSLGALVTIGTVVAMWRQRVRIADLDARAGLAEGLATYWQHRRGEGTAMRAWLAREVAARLRQLPLARAVGASGRRALRRLAYLVPLLLALLLLLLVWPFGLRTGERLGTQAPTPSAGAGDGPGDATPPPQSAGADKPTPSPEAGAPPPREEDTPGDGPAVPTRPLHLPVREEFVVPAFLGEGPTTRGQGREVTEEVTPPSTGNVGTPGGADTPEAPAVTFERARERALRARHVPAEERRIVERYFRALAEGGK